MQNDDVYIFSFKSTQRTNITNFEINAMLLLSAGKRSDSDRGREAIANTEHETYMQKL